MSMVVLKTLHGSSPISSNGKADGTSRCEMQALRIEVNNAQLLSASDNCDQRVEGCSTHNRLSANR